MTATTIVGWACALMMAFHGRSPPDRLADQHRYTTHSLAYPRANAARRRLVWPCRNRVFGRVADNLFLLANAVIATSAEEARFRRAVTGEVRLKMRRHRLSEYPPDQLLD